MDAQTSPPKSTNAALMSPTQARVHIWTTWLVPLLVCGALLALLSWAFRGLTLQQPVPIAITTAALCLAHTITSRALVRLWETRESRSPLAQRVASAVAALEAGEREGLSRRSMIALLCEEITTTLHPQHLECAAYDPRSSTYEFIQSTALRLPSTAVAHWITTQPEAVPLVLEARPPQPEPQRQLLDRGIRVIVSLGQSGWLALGPPEHTERYSKGQLTYLTRVCDLATETLLRAALIETRAQRSEELQVLYWIAQAVNFSTDVDTLLELVYTQLKRVMRLPSFYIALVDPERDELSFSFYIDNDERLYPDFTWSTSSGLTGVLLANDMTIRTADYTTECRQRDIEPKGPNIGRAWMGTALSAGDQTIGVMVVSASTPDIRFTETEENLFVTVGAYAAAILERHALYARLESRARELATLNEIGKLLASSLDLDEVLDLVVRNAAELLHSQAGSLLLLDEESGDLVFRISSGPASAHLIGMRIPAGKGIAGAAFSENRPVISQHTREDQRWYAEFDERSKFVTESVIAVPLNARGRTIGVLEVVNRRGGIGFTSADSELLLSFGAQAAIAIENARLFTTTDQALQARLQELTTLQVIDRQLNATLDYDTVMQQTLEWARHITGAAIGIVAALQEDDEGHRGLRFLAHQGYDDEAMLKYHDEALWPLNQGLIGYTASLGKTTLVTNLDDDAYQDELEPGMSAQLTVPIKRESRVIGTIVLESADVESFNEEHVALVERLADHAAIAIDNARLFEQVQQANAAKTEFISFVSHELKQPMTSIKGYADLLIKGVGGELNTQQRQFATVVRSNVGRMNRIVQDLLDVSRIEAGRLKLETGPVVAAEIIAEAAQAFEQAIAAKDQTLEINVQPDLPPVTGDRGRLIQVLTNLVSNANKYTPEGGVITLSADEVTRDGIACVRWQVADTGIGMSEDEVQQLFTKYFRSKRSAVRSVQGTGLGLVITQSIVQMHGGQIDVESQVNEGTAFSFTIPVSAPD